VGRVVARETLKRIAIRYRGKLRSLPSFQCKGLIVVEFKVENNEKKRKYQNLFMTD